MLTVAEETKWFQNVFKNSSNEFEFSKCLKELEPNSTEYNRSVNEYDWPNMCTLKAMIKTDTDSEEKDLLANHLACFNNFQVALRRTGFSPMVRAQGTSFKKFTLASGKLRSALLLAIILCMSRLFL